YALLVGTAWLFKARATINLKNMTATLEWAGSALTVPVTCWAEKTVLRRPDSDDESDLDSEDDTSSDDDDVGFATNLCTFTMTDQRLKYNQEVYPRAYEDYLRLRDGQIRHTMVLPTYSHRGPKKKCRCGLQLVADDDECDECQRNDQVFATLEVLPLEESTPVPTTLVRKLD